MPFETFDRSQLRLLPLAERVHDADRSIMINPDAPHDVPENANITKLASRVRAAKEKGAAIIFMMGAHVIKVGAWPLVVDLMKKGLITHLALNGACAIHDFEYALIGETTESVAKYISQGQFGLWNETGRINDAAVTAMREGIGLGEAIGRVIETESFKYKADSLLATAYRLGIPATVHVGIGNDIIHEHPNCDGAALGAASYTDFLIYAQSVTKLENGVFLNVGSAVAGPEVYLKCLSMARNVAHQRGEHITRFTTAVFDILPLEGEDFSVTPPKSDPRYYFRPWKTILARTVADGGESFYIQGDHRDTLTRFHIELTR